MLIGEVAERSGVSARMLRHYDAIGLVSPSLRTSGGYRQYSPDDMQRLFHVECLRSLGLSLHEIGEALSDLSFSPAAVVDALIARTKERIDSERRLLDRLSRLQASQPDDWSEALATIGLMRGLSADDPSLRQRHALSAGTLADRNASALAEAALAEPDPIAAGALYWALAQAGDNATEALTPELDSPAAERRHRAVAALEKINTPAAQAALAARLYDPDPLVRGRAALARGRGGQADAIPALIELILSGRDDVEATDVLADLAANRPNPREVTQAIIGALAVSDSAARERLTAALADIEDPSADAALAELSRDPERGVALTALAVIRMRSWQGS